MSQKACRIVITGRRNGLHQVSPLENGSAHLPPPVLPSPRPPLTLLSHHGSHVFKAGHPHQLMTLKVAATNSSRNRCTTLHEFPFANVQVAHRLVKWLHIVPSCCPIVTSYRRWNLIPPADAIQEHHQPSHEKTACRPQHPIIKPHPRHVKAGCQPQNQLDAQCWQAHGGKCEMAG